MLKIPMAFAGAATLAWGASAQTVHFTRNTDTIAVSGGTTLGDFYTIEAVVLRQPGGLNFGRIYAEQLNAQEDKHLYAGPNTSGGGVWSNGCDSSGVQIGPIAPDQWKHIAFVRDGGQTRLYVDGQVAGTNVAICPTVNAGGSATRIGAHRYAVPDMIDGAFRGYVDWVRVSSVARYSGVFVPPPCEPGPDSSTIMLFRFNEPAGSPTVLDEGSNHFTGTLGTGFTGATSPTLGPAPVSRLPVVSALADGAECPPGGAAFSASAAGAGPFTYLWQLELSPGNWATLGNDPMPLPCGGNASHAFAQPFDGPATTIYVRGCPGQFRVRAVVTGSCGSTTSVPGTLFVNSSDFDGDGDVGTDADIEAFFACLAGDCCATCGRADFNGDGDVGTDADIESFFRVLGGGEC